MAHRPHRALPQLWLPALFLLSGCFLTPETFVPHCVETRSAICLDDDTGLGFTAAEAVALIEGSRRR